MGMLKRILRQTSNKLLVKLGAHTRSSHQLVLNHRQDPSQAIKTTNFTGIKGLASNKSSGARKRRAGSKSKLTQSSREAFIPEALLVASRNNLPPVQFHHVHGPNALLSKNKFVARRTQSFCQALVFSNRVILPNERVYIKVLEIAKGWSGTIRFGFTSVDPATLRYQMPKHACPDMTAAGHTWARALADEVVRRNSVIHFSYNSNGYIHYGINNQDCGIFYANVNTSQHLWFIVDIYGLTAAVELIDPRIHNASSSELDLSRTGDDSDEDELDSIMHDRSTIFKSTSAMDQLVQDGTSMAGLKSLRRKSKRSRRAATGRSPLVFEQWAPEGLFLASGPMSSRFHPLLQQQQAARAMLPNLNSIILPPTQQNIYSPMPNTGAAAAAAASNGASRTNQQMGADAHDYYQIMTNIKNGEPQLQSIRIPANVSQFVAASQSQAQTLDQNNLEALGQQLEGIQISPTARAGPSSRLNQNSSSDNQRQSQASSGSQKGSATKATKTSEPQQPVAALRKRLQAQQQSKQSGRSADANQQQQASKFSHLNSSSASSSALVPSSGRKQAATSQAANLKPRARQSIKKVAVARDNNSPSGKDCPICFERPINCVLYQCGHMCTCYECGVKQWRTQSRTCPICRTVIKDVIKTYMS